MVKTRAPLRISFAGGGTDIEPYASEHGGCVLSAAIQMYTYAEYPIYNPSPNKIESTITDYFNVKGLRIISQAPSMSGLGGSASCFVAGIKAIRPDLEGKEIAELAFHLERNVMDVRGGKQDQYASALGGLNFLEFNSHGVDVESLHIPTGLEDLLFLVYMGKRNHSGHDIIKDQMARNNQANFKFQKQIVESMRLSLKANNLRVCGLLIEMAWQSKMQFSPFITTDAINELHDNYLKNGAIAGKLTGAGGGGYMLLMEDPEKRGQLKNYLGNTEFHRVKFHRAEFNTEGVICL